MVELGRARECDVFLAFLRAEVDSPAYGKHIAPWLAEAHRVLGIGRDTLIDNPDLENSQQNVIRKRMLSYRGLESRQALFCGFPTDVLWRRVELEPHELGRLKYIGKDENWMSFSEGTRRPSRVVERIAKGELLDNPGRAISDIQEKLRRGERFPELIAAEGNGDDLILIEGHRRATAYVGLNWSES